MFSRNLPSQSGVSKSTRGFSRRILTISVFPFFKATVMGVSPLLFLKLTSTLSSRDSNRPPPSGWLEFCSTVLCITLFPTNMGSVFIRQLGQRFPVLKIVLTHSGHIYPIAFPRTLSDSSPASVIARDAIRGQFCKVFLTRHC